MLAPVSWQSEHERLPEQEQPGAPEPKPEDPAAPLH
jgi:hypothetical protein